MNKLKALFVFLLFAGFTKLSIAQTSVNIIRVTPDGEKTSPNFIDDISFTPNGILQNTVSGGSKSIKVNEVPVVTKVNDTKTVDNESSSIESLSAIQYKYAMMLDVDMESLENLSLFSFIENWLGTRYRMGGTSKKGIDCSGFTSTLLMVVYGFAVPRTAREQYKATKHINKEDLQEGDLVFFNTRHGGVSHVGLYLDNNYFVQSSSSQGVTISSLEDGYYARKFICGGRIVKD
ncbi:MAG: C40 family peptidase [Ginsengibacter sp.]